MKKFFLFVGLLLLSNQLMAQSNWENFWKQSPPIKKWVVFHPFKAPTFLNLFLWSADLCDQTSICLLRGLAPLRKIEFGSTRRPRNMLMSSSIITLVVQWIARTDGRVVGIERVFFLIKRLTIPFPL